MPDIATIPMDQWPLRWRLTDPEYRLLSPAHLEQILPLDAASAKRLLNITERWYSEQPFTQGYFADVSSTSIAADNDEDVRRVRKWLYQLGIPFKWRVYLSWSGTDAAVATWKTVVRYWDDPWYPSSDDLAVFHESFSWALFMWHYEVAFFVSRPLAVAAHNRQ